MKIRSIFLILLSVFIALQATADAFNLKESPVKSTFKLNTYIRHVLDNAFRLKSPILKSTIGLFIDYYELMVMNQKLFNRSEKQQAIHEFEKIQSKFSSRLRAHLKANSLNDTYEFMRSVFKKAKVFVENKRNEKQATSKKRLPFRWG